MMPIWKWCTICNNDFILTWELNVKRNVYDIREKRSECLECSKEIRSECIAILSGLKRKDMIVKGWEVINIHR